MTRPRIFVASPLAAETKEGIDFNIRYATQACRLVWELGGDPFAPHIFYTRFLDDNIVEHRKQALECGFEHLKQCQGAVFFRPKTKGMKLEYDIATKRGIPTHSYVDKEGLDLFIRAIKMIEETESERKGLRIVKTED
jgi:hypothetical protein